eukprot:scaffold609_cov170-Amphora_coffeaeformis.AAC.13
MEKDLLWILVIFFVQPINQFTNGLGGIVVIPSRKGFKNRLDKTMDCVFDVNCHQHLVLLLVLAPSSHKIKGLVAVRMCNFAHEITFFIVIIGSTHKLTGLCDGWLEAVTQVLPDHHQRPVCQDRIFHQQVTVTGTIGILQLDLCILIMLGQVQHFRVFKFTFRPSCNKQVSSVTGLCQKQVLLVHPVLILSTERGTGL